MKTVLVETKGESGLWSASYEGEVLKETKDRFLVKPLSFMTHYRVGERWLPKNGPYCRCSEVRVVEK